MTEVTTAAQMRAIEHAAIKSGRVSGLELMERAGQGVVDAVFARWPALDKSAQRAAVLCGPGNNGGDGFVVARLLRERGWFVEVFFMGKAEKLPPDAKANYDLWMDGGQVQGEMAALRASNTVFEGYDITFDALFGIGLSRPISAKWGKIIERIKAGDAKHRTVAIDLPSGLDCDTGDFVGYLPLETSSIDKQHVGQFDMTVTFHRLKPAHLVAGCAKHCGEVIVVDIGL